MIYYNKIQDGVFPSIDVFKYLLYIIIRVYRRDDKLFSSIIESHGKDEKLKNGSNKNKSTKRYSETITYSINEYYT